MTRNIWIAALPLLLCAAAHSATISTTLTVSASATIGTTIAGTGTANLTNGIGSGTFTANISLTTYSGPFTISFGANTITGTLTLTNVATLLASGTGTATATITGGTGTYAGATGSFPNLAGAATGASTGNLTLTFTGSGTITTSGGGSTGGSTPTITSVLNNYGLVPAGFPNYGIAPGALFIIKGSGLADPSAQAVLQTSAAPGIPLTLNGASLAVTVNGTTVHPAIYYAIAGQIAAVLPSTTPPGIGTITATYNNVASAPATFTVVPAALGLGTYNGLAIATNPTTGALYSYTNSVKPGDTIVLWGSGLGAITADSDTVFTSTPHASTGSFAIYVGGVQASVLYAGDSGYPGVNQIDVTVPTSVTPGCNVTLVAVSGTGASAVTSNTTALSIATGGGVCTDPATGLTGTTTSTLAGQSTVKTGTLFVAQTTAPATSGPGTQTNDAALATFASTTGTSTTAGYPSIGSCFLSQSLTTTVTSSTPLDAGTLTLTGPTGSITLTNNPVVGGSYFAQLASTFIPSTGGTFTFNNGSGGKDVGGFSVKVTFPNPLLSWTNQSADGTISRSQGATFTWTGGSPGSYVVINGSSTAGVLSASFTCIAAQSAGQFTVPPSILLSLPPGSGSTALENLTAIVPFTASGLDAGVAFGASVASINTTFN
jgi:uncharacterized protein (TIGR03437 family)